MTGTDELRGQEYAALMSQLSELDRTSQWCWTAAGIAAAVLLSAAISARSPGLMLPVELCAAFGFYATVRARRRSRLIEGYLQEFHETSGEGPQWVTRLAHLNTLPRFGDRAEWLPLVLANAFTLAAVAFGWVFASTAPHGELMAGVATMAGVAFVVHALVEHLQLDAAHTAAMWNHLNGGLREVTPGSRRTGTQR